MGSNGWDTGAFGILIKDKKVDKTWEKGDPDQPNARSIYVETYDGIIRIIQTYGHNSLNKGLNHQDVYNLLKNLGYSNIRLAFLLDGGGTTRMYTRSDNGTERLLGPLLTIEPTLSTSISPSEIAMLLIQMFGEILSS